MRTSPTNAKLKTRLDHALVARGLAPSRARARDAILRGRVTVDGMMAEKPSATVTSDAAIVVNDPGLGYVSRGAHKLLAALDHFGYSPQARVALDIGASTGGFTEVLLERGARRVVSVDVGHGQLHDKLRTNPHVVNLESTDIRTLTQEQVGSPVGAMTVDVSFISLKLVLPAAFAFADNGAWGIFLVKPQFEVGRAHIGKGGIVRDPVAAGNAVDAVASIISTEPGWQIDGTIPSPIAGGDGNREFLIAARRG